jgi:hypothetical protein
MVILVPSLSYTLNTRMSSRHWPWRLRVSLLNKYGKARFLSDDSAATACTVDDRLDMVTMDSHHLGMVKHMGDSFQRKTTEDSVWNAVPYRIDTVYMCDYNDDRRNLLSILNLYYMLLLGHLSVCGMGQRSEH